MSLVAAGERIRGVADCEKLVQRIWRLLPAEDQRELRETFLGWLRQLMLRTGVDLEFLEDTAKMEQMVESGELRTTLEERFQAHFDAFRAEGRQEGLQQGLQQGQEQGLRRERQLLVRQAGRKFGTEATASVAGLLAGIDDPDRLQDIGEWIVDCDRGSEFIARL